MKTVKMSADRLAQLTAGFARARIAVMGDFFLDKYLEVDPELVEPSVETGLPAHQVVAIRCCPGAAGTICCNLAALEVGELHTIGFTGDDGEAYELRKELARLGCHGEHLHRVPERHTPTYLKPRDRHAATLEGEHSRYDTKNRTPTSASLEEALIRSLQQIVRSVDAVILLDQVEQRNCGVLTDRVRQAIVECTQQHPATLFWADSRRWIREFSRVVIKPNQFEAIGKDDPAPGEAVPLELLQGAAQKLRDINQAPVVVTRGAAGMLVSDPEWTLVPGVPVTGEIDPTGAGDSATAGAVLALCAGATLPEAALVGNLVASITIRQIGTTGVAHPYQLASALEAWEHRSQ